MQRTEIEDPISPSKSIANAIIIDLPNKKRIPPIVIRAMLEFKRASTRVNIDSHVLDPNIGALIMQASYQLLHQSDALLVKQFPLSIYTMYAGLHANTAVNKAIIAQCSNINPKITVTNDELDCSLIVDTIYPSVTNIVAALAIKDVINNLKHLLTTFKTTINQLNSPQLSALNIGYQALSNEYQSLIAAYVQLLELPINTHPKMGTNFIPDDFENQLVAQLAATYDLNFTAMNKYFSKPTHLGLADTHNSLHLLAIDLQTITHYIAPTLVNTPECQLRDKTTKIMDNDALISMIFKQSTPAVIGLKPVVLNSFLASSLLINELLTEIKTRLNKYCR